MRLRRSILVLSAVLALAACGGSDPAVLRLQSSPGGEAANASIDSKMAAPWVVDYELAPGLERPVDEARAWRASLPSDARKRFTDLARALGVPGEIHEQGTDLLTIGDPDGGKSSVAASNDSLTMWVGGGPASWSYYPAAATSSSGAVSEPCAPDAKAVPGCVPPSDADSPPPTIPEPENLPSENDALAIATRILLRAGYDRDEMRLTTSMSSWSTTVSFEEVVGGLPTGIFGAVDFGEDAEVMSAWGQFADYERGDSYPLIELADAVERMSSGWYGMPMLKSGAAASSGASTRSDTAIPAAPDVPVAATVTTDDIPGESTTTTVPRTEVVRLTGVALVLQPLYSSQTEVHLVPSYRFWSNDGEIGAVFAVPDKFIEVPVPDVPDTGAIEPAPVDPASSGSSGSGSGSSGSNGSGGSANPGSGPVTDMPRISDADAAVLVGLSETEADKFAASKGWTTRVVERDDEQFMVTADWRGDRVNLTVVAGKVTAVSVG